jgi:hypothetical protein
MDMANIDTYNFNDEAVREKRVHPNAEYDTLESPREKPSLEKEMGHLYVVTDALRNHIMELEDMLAPVLLLNQELTCEDKDVPPSSPSASIGSVAANLRVVEHAHRVLNSIKRRLAL